VVPAVQILVVVVVVVRGTVAPAAQEEAVPVVPVL
jgi:hypothetical protein